MGGPLPIGVFVNVASDHSGMFSVSGLHAGENALSISRYSGRGAEYAWVPLTIAADINDLTIRLQPGFTITGHITFEKAAPASHATLQVSSIPARLVGAIRSASVQPNPDGTFALEHQFGPTLIRAGGLRGWHLKSVQYAGRDVTDQPTEFATGNDVEIILTQRAATLSGTVTTRNGALTDAAVMLISDNPTLWNERATTSKLTNAAGDGKYRIEGLRAGRYLALALPKDEAALTGTTPVFFALLAKHGTPVSLDEGEPKVLDLKIVSLR